MAAPAFEFTDRATPIVQMGRSERRQLGDAIWGEGRWGEARWNAVDWEVLWTDLECEVHELTTQTGRGGATDRFVPGTAAIVASNVDRISDMIFPQVPETGQGFEFVPQPPITHEEDLQAPDADTVISDGWRFTDDFETAPPRWIFPPAWAATGDAPWGPFKSIDGAYEPELYEISTENFAGNAAAQWTAAYDPAGNSSLAIVLTGLDWPAPPTSGTPQVVVDLMLRMSTSTKECHCARFTLTPNFAGANTVTLELFHMGPTGSVIATGGVDTFLAGTGTNGVFGVRTLSVGVTFYGQLTARMSGVSTLDGGISWTIDTALTGTRIGMAVHYEQGAIVGDPMGGPRIIEAAGEDFTDDMIRPLGSGWTLPRAWRLEAYAPMIQADGAMSPTQRFDDGLGGGRYTARGMAQWVSEFDGDQALEVTLAGVSAPRPSGHTGTQSYLELYTHGNRNNRACLVVRVNYDPAWGSSDSAITWSVWQNGPNGEFIDYAPTVGGTINLGPTNGAMPEGDRWRVESDLAGEQRIYRNGTLLGTATAPDPPTGGRIGVSLDWQADNLFPNGQRRPDVVRLLQLTGGLRKPLGTEELGCWVRIGVDHTTLGKHWLFRGFVDAVVPSYVPERQDAVRIECIDSLGEAGRPTLDGDQLSHPFFDAPGRIAQVLNAAAWPRHFRTIEDDSTIMSRPSSGKAVDALTQVAESCGGAVYGDPATGDVVFKGMDWQGRTASEPPSAFLTNYHPNVDDGIPRVCPSGWERSSRRQEMNTRVKYSTVTSQTQDGEPIVKEWRHAEAEALYGVEKYERTLICTTAERVNELAIRQLRLRSPAQYPRIEAVLLDAATADEALDLMTTATFTGPSKYWCQHREGNEFVFNRKMLVTGVRHVIKPDSWICRLALDPSSVFYEAGDRWDEGRWGAAEWGRSR